MMKIKIKSMTIKNLVSYCKVCDRYYDFNPTYCFTMGCNSKLLIICQNCAKKCYHIQTYNLNRKRYCLKCFRKLKNNLKGDKKWI